MRVLILTCNTGGGHNAVAAALKESLESRGAGCDVMDGLGFISKKASKFVSKWHTRFYRRYPELYKAGYMSAEKDQGMDRRDGPVYRYIARGARRLGRTIQLTDTGITPGSGIGNHRNAINRKSVGVPVISLGVPTVVDARTLCADLSGAEIDLPDDTELFVTPRDIDTRVRDSARLVGYAIDLALHDALTIEDIDMFLT